MVWAELRPPYLLPVSQSAADAGRWLRAGAHLLLVRGRNRRVSGRSVEFTRLRKQSPYPRGHLPFVRREHVIGAAVGSCSRRRSRPPGIRADEGSPRGGRHLFVSDDERVAGVNA
jgi:hypothetical protein